MKKFFFGLQYSLFDVVMIMTLARLYIVYIDPIVVSYLHPIHQAPLGAVTGVMP